MKLKLRNKISLCTTALNSMPDIAEHLESIYSRLDEDCFEYIVVDSMSTDGSWEYMVNFRKDHPNLRLGRKKCLRGIGRQMAFKAVSTQSTHVIQVDTDAIYTDIWIKFIKKYFSSKDVQGQAVQAPLTGIYPKELLESVGGWNHYHYGEDLDLWMRIHKLGKMNWYNIVVGEHRKDSNALASLEYRGNNFNRSERLKRLWRAKWDEYTLREYHKMALEDTSLEHSTGWKIARKGDRWFPTPRNITLANTIRYIGFGTIRLLLGR